MSIINRIYVNSYLSYINELSQGENATNFRFNLPQTLSNVKALIPLQMSLTYCPTHPNISTYESVIKMTATISAVDYVITLNIPTNIFYRAVYDSTGTYPDLISELMRNSNYTSSPSLPTNFTTDVGAWTFNENIQRLIFTPVAGCDVVFNTVNDNAYRRVGIPATQLGVVYDNASPLTCSNPVMLLRTQVIYIACPNVVNDSISNVNSSYTSSIIASFPVYNPAYGSLLLYEGALPIEMELNGETISEMNFILLDDQFKEIQMNSNSNLCISFDVVYEGEDFPEHKQMTNQIKPWSY